MLVVLCSALVAEAMSGGSFVPESPHQLSRTTFRTVYVTILTIKQAEDSKKRLG